MPQVLSTDSFNMGERGRVFLSITYSSYVLLRSINIDCYTSHNQRVT